MDLFGGGERMPKHKKKTPAGSLSIVQTQFALQRDCADLQWLTAKRHFFLEGNPTMLAPGIVPAALGSFPGFFCLENPLQCVAKAVSSACTQRLFSASFPMGEWAFVRDMMCA